VGLEPAIPDKEGRHAKHPAIRDGKSIARPQSSQFDLSDTMHGYVAQCLTLAERDVSIKSYISTVKKLFYIELNILYFRIVQKLDWTSSKAINVLSPTLLA
jgi:hypothetical protein